MNSDEQREKEEEKRGNNISYFNANPEFETFICFKRPMTSGVAICFVRPGEMKNK